MLAPTFTYRIWPSINHSTEQTNGTISNLAQRPAIHDRTKLAIIEKCVFHRG